MDEFGLPIEWRRIDEVEHDYPGFTESWEVWEDWCRAKGCRAFPARIDEVVAFLSSPPVHGKALDAVLDAMSHRHDGVYWNINANPADMLRLHGARLLEDGKMFLPPEVLGDSHD